MKWLFEQTVEPDQYDPKIKDLINTMNQITGIATHASCQGHIRQLSSPYVAFSATEHHAKNIEVQLRRLWHTGELHTRWKIDGVFNDKLSLVYRLSAPRYNQCKIKHWWWRGFYFHIQSKKITHDIDTIKNAIHLTMRSEQ
jgi:tRNA(Phe) wybutosine-synthesizing methylase Tyw3